MWEDTEAHDRAMQRAVDEHGWCYLHSALADDCRECMNQHRDRAIEEHGWCDEHQTIADTCKACRDEHDGEEAA